MLLLALIAATKIGVTLPDKTTVEGNELVLNGLGVREATIFKVDVYVAGLYLEKKSTDAKAIVQAPDHKRLVLHFVRDVDKSDLTGAFTEGFAKNGGDKLGPRIEKLNGMLSPMKRGEELVFTYVPGKGLEVRAKGKSAGTIAGADFAAVFFSIFVGPKPPNAGLKKGLLGG